VTNGDIRGYKALNCDETGRNRKIKEEDIAG